MKKVIKEFSSFNIKKCRKDDEICGDTGECSMLKAERELAVESLRAHLSEQRHDFFNLLQVLYGYTQLNRPDKVLVHIKEYCGKMENIGRLYNCKCIKLADLLYTKGKEAESIDINLEVSIEVSFDPVVRILDEVAVLHAVDYAISGFLYVLDKNGLKNTHLVYNLKEDANDFIMEISCRELGEGQFGSICSVLPKQVTSWSKIERDVVCFESIAKHCSDSGFDGRMLEDGSKFILSIHKT